MAPSFKNVDGLFATVDCVDWFDFRQRAHAFLTELPGKRRLSGDYLFRGQSCSSWPLIPSFDRENDTLSPVEADERYERMMAQFRNAFETYGDLSARGPSPLDAASPRPSDSELEALAQHHGLPTRLLDWSHSLYVAAFFAFSKVSDCSSGQVSVWALHTPALKFFSEDHLAARLDPHKSNTRHVFQWGAFLRNKTGELNADKKVDLVQIFRKGSRFYNSKHASGYPALIRFDIPQSAYDVAMDDLNAMRINSMTIFPGIDGVVQWIRTGGTVSR